MKRLKVGTLVKAIDDFSPFPSAGEVKRGALGRIVRAGPDASYGWYVVQFGDTCALMPVEPAQMAHVRVVDAVQEARETLLRDYGVAR